MPTSTRRRAQHHIPPPPAEFSDSDQDVDEEEMEPEEDMGEDMVAMDGDEDLEGDRLGKSFLATHPGIDLCHVTWPSCAPLGIASHLHYRNVHFAYLRATAMQVTQARAQRLDMLSLLRHDT